MKNKTGDYKAVRDLAWDVLIRNGISSLPVDVYEICKRERINVFNYSTSSEFMRELQIDASLESSDAFSIGSIIFVDDTKPRERQRFSVAHELGHILLHIPERQRIFYRETASQDPVESEANMFASRLLAPLCVLQFADVGSAREIAELCDISYTAAKIRYSRLCEIRKRNSVRRAEKNHGTFLISRKERALLENFKEFIEQRKANKKEEGK